MGAEKLSLKAGGFFHLFDWNKKSRKKLFVNGTASPEGAKQEKKSNDSLLAARLSLIDDDEIGGLSSAKGSSDYSCASSVTDEEGIGTRAPGVVARLMGLDSLPTSGVSEPYSTPLFDARSHRDNHHQKRSPEFDTDNQYNNVSSRAECSSRKPIESRSQKMPSSPIERFQKEVLPPRSAKSLPITHYKLLSPIKNPRFISGKNAAHIMEAAAKILEPGLQANSRSRVLSIGPSPLPLKVQNLKESMAVSQRASRVSESSRMNVELNAAKHLRGQHLNKSWNSSEDNISLRASPDWEETGSMGTKTKGKSVSLAIQAKVNVQRREGQNTSGKSALVQREQDEFKLNQTFRSQPSTPKSNKLQRKASTPGATGALKQNNRKHNSVTGKEKFTSKPSISNQLGRKGLSGDASSGRNRTLNKNQRNSRLGYRKEDLQTTDMENEESLSRTKNVPRKKRLIDGDFQSEKSGFTDNILVGRHEKRAQPSVVIDEQQKWGEDNRRNGTDVVSFTFTSPMIKPMPGPQSSNCIIEKWDARSGFCIDTRGERNFADVKNNKLPSLGLNFIGGDPLSILLERKLRDLTSGFETSHFNLVKVGSSQSCGSFLGEGDVSAFETTVAVPMENENETTPGPGKSSLGSKPDSALTSIDSQAFDSIQKLQEAEGVMECSSSSDARKEPDHQHPSPLSVLEASFSNESCNSSDSCDSTNGSKICYSFHAHRSDELLCTKKNPSVEVEMELSDSACSTFLEISNEEEREVVSHTSHHTEPCKQEVEYVREILCNADLSTDDLTLDPLLFDLLENKNKSRGEGEDKVSRLRRKVLFDCVSECVEIKRRCYLGVGYQTWAKGVVVLGRMEEFADGAYKEISGWRSMGDWMVDELVDKDMSSHVGRWIDFETEAFETGVEIEDELLSCLVDEVVADFLV